MTRLLGVMAFTQAQLDELDAIASLYELSDAPENQLHETAALRLAKVAEDVGFYSNAAAALEALKNRPLSTLIRLFQVAGAV